MVFLSPLYSLVYEILDSGHRHTFCDQHSRRGCFLTHFFFTTFVTLNVWDFLLHHGQAENYGIGRDVGFSAHSHLCFLKKEKKKAANQHTHTIQTD